MQIHKAEKRKRKGIYLSASTLIEVLVALVILMIIAGISLHVFMNVGGFMGNREKVRAMVVVDSELDRIKANRGIQVDAFVLGSLRIQAEVLPLSADPPVSLISVKALHSKTNAVVYERHEIVPDESAIK